MQHHRGHGRRWLMGRLGKATGHKATLVMLLLPLVLAACGGESVATNTAAPNTAASTVGATAVATIGSATKAATAAASMSASAANTPAAMAAMGSGTVAASSLASGSPFGTPLTTKRGEGGTLRLLWWQAPTVLNVHLSNGTKDTDASSMVTEPLARISTNSLVPDVPILSKEIPSVGVDP